MLWVKIICFALIFLIWFCDSLNVSEDKMTIDTFESTDKRLVLLRTSRNVQIKANIVLLKRKLKTLITRRRLQYEKLKTTKNKMTTQRLKTKLKTLNQKIKKLRLNLIKQKKTTRRQPKLYKASNINEIQAAFTLKHMNINILRELHEKCKNHGCSQLCTPDVLNKMASNASATQCHCHRGFYLDQDNKTCLDINECNLQTTKCEYKCFNTMGSHYCACPKGKKLSYDKSTCIDINECFLNNNHGPCQDGCVNIEGAYRCTCDRFSGTRLNQNGHSCEDIDECLDKTSNCSHDCFNVYNSYVCGCPEGMFLGDDYQTCIDINECQQTEIKKTCIGKCINTIGSYFCLNIDNPSNNYSTCDQLPSTKDGYHLCNRNDTVKLIMKGITDREHFLNYPGTICTYYTSFHKPVRSHVCNDRANWEDYLLTLISNFTVT